MDGYGGQSILIDFENERIVSVIAIHQNYNWKKLYLRKLKLDLIKNRSKIN